MAAPGPVVLITGCSKGGIGYALCEEFARQGCRVYATARNADRMKGLSEQGINTLELDVTQPESVKCVVLKVLSSAGTIDILVNNAGVGGVMPLLGMELERARSIFDTNYFGALSLILAVSPRMVERRSGTIVNIGSVVSFGHSPFTAVYNSTKAAIESLCHSLRVELKPFGVHVMYVAPGLIKTAISQKAPDWNKEQWKQSAYAPIADSLTEMFKPAHEHPHSSPPSELAKRVVAAAMKPSPPLRVIYGHQSGVVWFLSTCLPRWLLDRIYYSAMNLGVLEKQKGKLMAAAPLPVPLKETPVLPAELLPGEVPK